MEENKGLSLKRARKAHDSALHSAVNKWSMQEIADSRPTPIYGSQKVAGLMWIATEMAEVTWDNAS